jgi:hypothetical protein
VSAGPPGSPVTHESSFPGSVPRISSREPPSGQATIHPMSSRLGGRRVGGDTLTLIEART